MSFTLAALGVATLFAAGSSALLGLCAGLLLLGAAWQTAGGRWTPARVTAPARRRGRR